MSETFISPEEIPVQQLPEEFYFVHTNDRDAVLKHLPDVSNSSAHMPIDPELITDVEPPEDVYTAQSVSIDFEAIMADARGQESHKFKKVIRGGNIFEVYSADWTVDDLEAFAVNLLGPDMSLYLHGSHQARRMDRLMSMQQIFHQRVFRAIHAKYGNTKATLDVYSNFSNDYPNFDLVDVKYGNICGFKHDDGEAKIGHDRPYGKKTKEYEIRERAIAVDFAKQMHVPVGMSAELWDILDRRFKSDTNPNIVKPTRQELEEVEMHLHPGEITNALFGTEALVYENVERGIAFNAVEKIEYVLTALRVFEAFEHDRMGVRSDSYLSQELLGFAADSLLNHLEDLMAYAERYIGVYDFIRYNQADIDRYLNSAVEIINARDDGETNFKDTIFGADPFKVYDETEGKSRTADQAMKLFEELTAHWSAWQSKEHMTRTGWESIFGTDNPLDKEQKDILFTHYTARRRQVVASEAGRIILQKPIEDQFGVGLDPDDRREHEEYIYS